MTKNGVTIRANGFYFTTQQYIKLIELRHYANIVKFAQI